MTENRMVIDSQWNDWQSFRGENSYENASDDSILCFLADCNKLHEVLGQFIEADDYDELAAEEIILEYLSPIGRKYLLRSYLHNNDIEADYNDWAFRYWNDKEP